MRIVLSWRVRGRSLWKIEYFQHRVLDSNFVVTMSALSKYLHEIFRDAKKFGDKASKDFGEDDIHEMRVAVKKIKAAFHFLQFVDPDSNDDEFKKLKKIFSDAGELREWQLLSEVIKKFQGLK